MGVLISLLPRAAVAISSIAFLLTGNTTAVVFGGVVAVLSSIYTAKQMPIGSHKHMSLVCAVVDTLLVFLFVPLFFQAGWEWWFLLGAWLMSSLILGRSKVRR